jgi:cyclophilin family peptidyl-prolyl cis-trans isomerase
VTAIETFIATQKIDTASPTWRTQLPQPPKVPFDPARTYFWNIQTSKGPIKVKLLPQVAPLHVSSTIYLTLTKFYDGLAFHRVIPGFMAQGGCPAGNGSGGPGYQFGGEFSPQVRHTRPGLLSMANRGPGTDGSQFFLTFQPTPHLDGKHTIFGEVVEGMETLQKLESAGTQTGATTERLVMEKCAISVE